MYADNRFQSSVVTLRKGVNSSPMSLMGLMRPIVSRPVRRIMYHVTVILDKTFHHLLRCHEHCAMLMAYRKNNLVCLVFKGFEVLSAMGTVDFVLV
jgi:hypothetical protein